MKDKERKPPKLTEYRSWDEYLQAIASLPDESPFGTSREWGGASSVKEARTIAALGWPEGMDYIRSITLPALNTLTSEHSSEGDWVWDVTGATYDVGEYLTGTPECWLNRSVEGSKPLVTIGIDTCTSSGVPSEMIRVRGAAIVALAMALQGAGYAVRVFAVSAIETYGQEIWQRTLLTDDQGGPLDLNRMLFALAHPANTRTLSYSNGMMLRHGRVESSLNDGLGTPKGRGLAEWPMDLYLSGAHLYDCNWSDKSAVTEWIRKQYETLTTPRQ